MIPLLLIDQWRVNAINTIKANHYTHSVPSGKSYYFACDHALVVYSIPANKNIAKFILGWPGKVWELSRLWAPDGHEPNLLTQAISVATRAIWRAEHPDAVVSYADPSAGHKGGVYRAASWIYHGQSDEVRAYRSTDGQTVSRRAFHSGGKGMTKAQIEALGYVEFRAPGKERFVHPLSKRASKAMTALFDDAERNGHQGIAVRGREILGP